MFKKKGIAIKIFAFTSILIVFVVVISFGILYLVMPKYYSYMKNNTMEKNSDVLVENINKAKDSDELEKLIDDFWLKNNASVTSYDDLSKVLFKYTTGFADVVINSDIGTDTDTDKNINVYTTPHITQRTVIDESGFELELPSKDTIFIETAQVTDSNMKEISIISTEKKVDSDFIDKIIITTTLQPINEANSVILSLIPYLLIIDVVIALVSAFFFTKQITTPIIKLSEKAVAMQKLTPNIVSGITSNDEFGTLSKNLDLLYSNLCSNIENLKFEIEKVSMLEKSKTDFMRSASHELKTPIAGLNGIIEGMIDGVGKFKDRDKYLVECKTLIDKMTGLVVEILLSSKLECGADVLNIKPLSVIEILEKSIEEHKIFIDEKLLIIKITNNDINIKTDENIFKNAVSNIISNAVRYTKHNGEINISINEDENHSVLSIENECDNINEDELLKIFEPFYTIDYSRNKDFSGTGLGLFIVKNNLNMLWLKYDIKNTKLGIQFNIYFEKSL